MDHEHLQEKKENKEESFHKKTCSFPFKRPTLPLLVVLVSSAATEGFLLQLLPRQANQVNEDHFSAFDFQG